MSTRSDSVNIPTSIYVPYPGRRQARLWVTMTEHGSIYGEEGGNVGLYVRERWLGKGRRGNEEGINWGGCRRSRGWLKEKVTGGTSGGEGLLGTWEHERRNGWGECEWWCGNRDWEVGERDGVRMKRGKGRKENTRGNRTAVDLLQDELTEIQNGKQRSGEENKINEVRGGGNKWKTGWRQIKINVLSSILAYPQYWAGRNAGCKVGALETECWLKEGGRTAYKKLKNGEKASNSRKKKGKDRPRPTCSCHHHTEGWAYYRLWTHSWVDLSLPLHKLEGLAGQLICSLWRDLRWC